MADAAFYAEMLATANELLDFFGQSGTAIVPGATTGDAFNPTPGTPASSSIILVEIDFQQKEIDGTTVLQGDKRLIIKADAPSLIPSSTQISYGGVTHQVIGPVVPLNPGGTLMIYTAHVRAI